MFRIASSVVLVSFLAVACGTPAGTLSDADQAKIIKDMTTQNDPLAGGKAPGTYPVEPLGEGEHCWAGWTNMIMGNGMTTRTGMVVRRAWDAKSNSVLEEQVTFLPPGQPPEAVPSRSLQRYTLSDKTFTAMPVKSSPPSALEYAPGPHGTFEGTNADWTIWTVNLDMTMAPNKFTVKAKGATSAAGYTQTADLFMNGGQTGQIKSELPLLTEAECKDKLSRVAPL